MEQYVQHDNKSENILTSPTVSLSIESVVSSLGKENSIT